MMAGDPPIALALFSGGLDSILACRVIMAQGITVKAVKFVTPFFGDELLPREEGYRREIKARFDIDVQLRDLSEPYLKMLGRPVYGYGKNFNPCLDCKILIVATARAMLTEIGASFIISGEVVGQRPMSQRLDAMRVVERDSGCEGLLLRPLSAGRLPETIPERQGLVDRERLPRFSGRSRTPQIELAAALGISGYPSPAGGCILTDPNKAFRIRRFYEEHPEVQADDLRLLMVGRQFQLQAGSWLVLGRDQRENELLLALVRNGDLLLRMSDWPGPVAVIRNFAAADDLELAACLIRLFSKKGEGRRRGRVLLEVGAGVPPTREIAGEREIPDSEWQNWLR
jgi:tRNA U34 2-thiouridine synthase MnmA/TrmU